jgi:hypothetical protein
LSYSKTRKAQCTTMNNVCTCFGSSGCSQNYLVYNKRPLFVSTFRTFWPLKAVANCQTLSFSASFYKICLGKNYSKST